MRFATRSQLNVGEMEDDGTDWLGAGGRDSRGRIGAATAAACATIEHRGLEAVVPGIFATSDVTVDHRLDFGRRALVSIDSDSNLV